MKRSQVLGALLGLVFIIGPGGAAGAAPAAPPGPWATGISRAEDLVVRLVTIGPADPIYTWWGHSALIVEDSRLEQSRFYNYGLFSFEQKSFLLNFSMGRLWFQVGASATDRELAYYRYLQRSIHLQTLDLSPAQALEMARFLETNILAENRTYLYDHYDDNCATRVRDLIDRTIDGQLAAATARPGRMTLRQHTRRFTSHAFLVDWLLMFLMSDVIDKPVSRWQEMFLPGELERNVGELRYRGENGMEKPLVSETAVFYEARGQRVVPDRAPAHWPWGLALGVFCGLLHLLPGLMLLPAGRGRRALADCGARSGLKAARVLWGVCSALTGLVFGCLGSVLFFMSVFTDHTVTYANKNLFLANPLTFLTLPLGIAVIVTAGSRDRGDRPGGRLRLGASGWLALLWYVLAGISALCLLLKLFRAFDQKNLLAAATIVPVLFGLAVASFVVGKKKSGRSGSV